MSYWILKSNGSVESRTTVQHITADDMKKDETRKAYEEEDKAMRERLKDDNFVIPDNQIRLPNDTVVDDEYDQPAEYPKDDEGNPQQAGVEQDDYTPEAYDELLGAELNLPTGTEFISGRVTKRKRDDEGRPVGVRNQNPLLDTRLYEVEMADGTTGEYTTNIIAENLFAQVDSEGRQFMLLD